MKKIFGLPFDDELFLKAWHDVPDLRKQAFLDSGVMVHDPLIENALVNEGGNFYTIPFYSALTGDPVNYDGQTDITAEEVVGDAMSGIAFGRAKGWKERDFRTDLSSGDPFGRIAGKVGDYWNAYRQKVIIGILSGVFDVASDADFAKHTVDLTTKGTVDAKIEATTLNSLASDVLGDNKGAFKIAIMHSQVAKTLENLQILEYWKQTDSNGVQRPIGLASVNGYTVFIDDGVPVDTSRAHKQYTTYLLGDGVLRYGKGALSRPVEADRDPAKNGGTDFLYTRIRESIHVNGFSYQIPKSGFTESPTDEQLFNKANWKRAYDHKAIPLARLITTG